MSIYSLPPLLSTFIYAVLIAIVVKKTRTREIRSFVVYLAISLISAIGIFMLLSGAFIGQTRILAIVPPLFGIMVAISYYHFICNFTHKAGRLAVWLGYAAVALILLPLFLMGYNQYRSGHKLWSIYLPAQSHGFWLYFLVYSPSNKKV